jgi:hypothetical protein
MYGRDVDGEGKVKISKGMVFYNISTEAGSTLHALLQPAARAVAA